MISSNDLRVVRWEEVIEKSEIPRMPPDEPQNPGNLRNEGDTRRKI
jgi:hypothetical protein